MFNPSEKAISILAKEEEERGKGLDKQMEKIHLKGMEWREKSSSQWSVQAQSQRRCRTTGGSDRLDLKLFGDREKERAKIRALMIQISASRPSSFIKLSLEGLFPISTIKGGEEDEGWGISFYSQPSLSFSLIVFD